MLIDNCLLQMKHCGMRRLLVISGSESWCYQQALQLSEQMSGDWLWISTAENKIPPTKAKSLLGREYKHAVFDAREGFNAEAFAILAGTLTAGSFLVLLVPQWTQWCNKTDIDSLRWTELPEPISTPRFISYLQRILLADPDILLWRQGQALQGQLLSPKPDWQPANGQPTDDQQRLLDQLINAPEGIYVLTAARGRGKSALAGQLANLSRCWLTAPNKMAIDSVRQFSGGHEVFFSPDALLELEHKPDIDWLIIDEAAAIPTALLYQLVNLFPRVLLTTTIQGYEGTGRGFMLKFCSALKDWTSLTLNQPIRWAEGDPLERVVDTLLLMQTEYQDKEHLASPDDLISVMPISQQALAEDSNLLTQFYGLLISAHYRSSPLDLRRLLDAPNMSLGCALDSHQSVIGAIWGVDEGGLTEALSQQVWAGYRRPKGNLVAQALAAYAGIILAPTLHSIRISRIAVQNSFRRRGIAKQLIEQQVNHAKKRQMDYLSVSFGYTEQLYAFWRACGFILVHIGSHKEASSGCYSAMALRPLSDRGQKLTEEARQQFSRNWHWLKSLIPLSLADDNQHDDTINDHDWQELSGFAFAYRQPEASYASLGRLLHCSSSPCQALRLWFEEKKNETEIITQLNLSGRAELIQRWRQEVAQALADL